MATRAGFFLNAAREALTPMREATQPLLFFTAKSVASTRDVAGIAFFHSVGQIEPNLQVLL